MDETSLKGVSESGLRQFLTNMATLAVRFQREAIYPKFEPSLVWQSTDGSTLCTLLPLDETKISETDLIRIVTKAFYRFATGRGGLGCLNRFSASISGASAGVRLPSGAAAG